MATADNCDSLTTPATPKAQRFQRPSAEPNRHHGTAILEKRPESCYLNGWRQVSPNKSEGADAGACALRRSRHGNRSVGGVGFQLRRTKRPTNSHGAGQPCTNRLGSLVVHRRWPTHFLLRGRLLSRVNFAVVQRFNGVRCDPFSPGALLHTLHTHAVRAPRPVADSVR